MNGDLFGGRRKRTIKMAAVKGFLAPAPMPDLRSLGAELKGQGTTWTNSEAYNNRLGWFMSGYIYYDQSNW